MSGPISCRGPNVDVECDCTQSRPFRSRFNRCHFLCSPCSSICSCRGKPSLEMNKVLKPGGLVLAMTHQSFPPHDQPWDSVRFTDQAWSRNHIQSPSCAGFEVVEIPDGRTARDGRQRWLTGVTKGFADTPGYAGSAAICRKISETTLSWPANLDDIVSTANPK